MIHRFLTHLPTYPSETCRQKVKLFMMIYKLIKHLPAYPSPTCRQKVKLLMMIYRFTTHAKGEISHAAFIDKIFHTFA